MEKERKGRKYMEMEESIGKGGVAKRRNEKRKENKEKIKQMMRRR